MMFLTQPIKLYSSARSAPMLLAVLLTLAPAPARSQLAFEDATEASGLAFRHNNSKTDRKYLPETMSGGVALLDYDDDGFVDVFFVNGARLDFPHPAADEPDKSDPRFWNRLYRNQGDGTFRDVTESTNLAGRGYGMGAAAGDFDNDGYPDLVVTNAAVGEHPAVLLYRNEGGERFADVTAEANIAARGWAAGAGFLDYDNDGDLDLFVGRYLQWRFEVDQRCGMEATSGRAYCHPDLFDPVSNYLFRNDGGGKFEDVSAASGIAGVRGKALGVGFNDFDSDGALDIAVANDSFPQFLFHNKGGGKFEEIGLFAGVAYNEDGEEYSGMGIAFADLDQDGHPDIVTTTLSQEKYAVFYNSGEQAFDYFTSRSGLGSITQLYAGWGLAAVDFDHDGGRDLFFANGHVMDNIERSQPHLRYLQPPLLLTARGRRFVNVTSTAGELFERSWAGRGVAAGDLDNDGDVDLVVSNLNQPALLARNLAVQGGGAHWVGLILEGCTSNRDAIGARVEHGAADGSRSYATLSPAGSYLSSSDKRIVFGLGAGAQVGTIEVHWPGGDSTTAQNLEPDRYHRIQQNPNCSRP